MQEEDLLSVEMTWSKNDTSTYQVYTRAAPTLGLCKALQQAHDEAQHSVVWPTRGQSLEERRLAKKQHSDSRDHGNGQHRGDGGSGGDGSWCGGP